MISQTAAYALRAVIHLARESGKGPVRGDDVADALGVPRNYLSKILHALARDGMLDSTRGPGGGFRLVTPPSTLRIAEVIEGFDPMAERSGCLLGRDVCDDADPCPAHARWKGLSAELSDFFENTTVADLAELAGDDFPGLAGGKPAGPARRTTAGRAAAAPHPPTLDSP